MHSAIYQGWVRHRRFRPRPHMFRYDLFMMYLDLDELDRVMALSPWFSRERFNVASFRRADYLGPSDVPLASAVRDRVGEATGQRPAGPVRVLTHLRYFGHVFNPVTFYYCFAENDGPLETIVAQITNTPWKERHEYILPTPTAGHLEWQFDKAFHVSPFMAMERQYRWRFEEPGDELRVHMDVGATDNTEMDASLALHRQELSRSSMASILRKFPMLCTRITLGIHIQAFKLWLKRVPVHDHPSKRKPAQ